MGKNVHVVAFAMINLEHHGGAPAEGPTIDDGLS